MREHLAGFIDDLRRLGDDTAIVRHVGNRRRRTSYAELAETAGRFAALLVARRIAPGDRVVLWGENSAEWVAAFYGCVLRGVIAVPLDAHGTAEFAARVAADVRPSLMVGDAGLLATFEDGWERVSFEEFPTGLPAPAIRPVAGLSRETPLQILFTSGTTGEPKGIVHTHGNVLASIEPIEQGAQPYLRYERLVHPLRFLHTLPLSHVFGQTMGLWIPPVFAAEVHFESRLVAARLVQTIRQERISVLVAVPRVLGLLKNYLDTGDATLPDRVKAARGIKAARRWWRFRDIHAAFGFKFWAFVTGGGALPATIEEFWNGLGFVLVQGYGMTETAALITLNHPFHVARGTIGKPLPGREVKLGPDGEVLVRGAMISAATWSGGGLKPREAEWLATGDIAEAQATGELRFLGRKSEVIVTGAGVNIHPEDLEAALDQEPDVRGCAVMRVEGAFGPEACAVLALHIVAADATAIASGAVASDIVRRANARLAEFQRMQRWFVWPEPDLPRTSTGKVRRAAVAAWLATRDAGAAGAQDTLAHDWLASFISGVTGEAVGDEDAELRLDSLGRVQLQAALEERLGAAIEAEVLTAARTARDVRRLIHARQSATTMPSMDHVPADSGLNPAAHAPGRQDRTLIATGTPDRVEFVYPRWPWRRPVQWIRTAFQVAIQQPLVWLLAAPKVGRQAGPVAEGPVAEGPVAEGPVLIVANHVTAYDLPLLLYALPPEVRRRTAVAMAGEMLEGFRHGRGLDSRWLDPLGPLAWLLMTALFNVFPLPRQRGFQRSFDHVGEALDRGYNVIVFPEGTRSADGAMARFRPGIGLLVKQSRTAVLPMALLGVGELKARGHGWFRSGTIEVRIGRPMRFAPEQGEAEIAGRLEAEVMVLLRGDR